MIVKCKQCGSTDIQVKYWCNPNTLQIIDVSSGEENECWCEKCQEETKCEWIEDDDSKQHETLHFINSRHETEWGYQLPDGRIIDLLDAEGFFALKYDRAFNLQTGEVFPEGKHPDGSVTLNDLNHQGGKTVHCYDEVVLNYSHRYVLSPGGLKIIQKRFAKKGYNVTKEAIQHQYDCWKWGGKSGYRDEQNGYHLFTPAGVNPFSLRLTTLHEKCSDWQKTYMG